MKHNFLCVLMATMFISGCSNSNTDSSKKFELGDSDYIGSLEMPSSNDISQVYPYGVTAKTPPTLKSTKKTSNSPSKYRLNLRISQGCPQVEIAENGRLWAVWLSSNECAERSHLFDVNDKDKRLKLTKENPAHSGQFGSIATSMDGGKTWKEVFVFDPIYQLGATSSDILLWKDIHNKIRLVVVRNMYVNDKELGDVTSWEFVMNNPENEDPNFSKPRLIGRYNMSIIKPLLFDDGSILRSCDIFQDFDSPIKAKFVKENSDGSVDFVSHINYPKVSFAEQSLLMKKDKTIAAIVRMRGNCPRIFESSDNGKTWKDMGAFSLGIGVDTKTIWGRLKSGRVLLLANDVKRGEKLHFRSKMTAFLSDDDGKTFPHKLLLDERKGVSYPSFAQDKDGSIYVVYDHGRAERGKHEILYAKITENDIISGKVSNASVLKGEVIFPCKSGCGLKDGDTP